MFGMSLTEMLMIVVVILVVMGPEKIPEVARFVGKAMREVRKASNLLRDAVVLDEMALPNASSKKTKPTDAKLDGSDDDVWLGEPEENYELRAVGLAERTPAPELPEVVEVPLAAAASDVAHREVYLHVPYEETL